MGVFIKGNLFFRLLVSNIDISVFNIQYSVFNQVLSWYGATLCSVVVYIYTAERAKQIKSIYIVLFDCFSDFIDVQFGFVYSRVFLIRVGDGKGRGGGGGVGSIVWCGAEFTRVV